MRILQTTILAMSVLLSLVVSVEADCSSAVSQYNSVVGDIDSYLRRYARCVGDSRGMDDCSSEFRRLRSAQSDFEDAVSRYGSECRR
jgi:hypothetical protein